MSIGIGLGGGIPTILEMGMNLGILLVAGFLAALTWKGYLQNREKKLAYIATAFTLFAFKGLLVSIENLFKAMPNKIGYQLEIVEHIAPIFTLIALVLFFVALIRN